MYEKGRMSLEEWMSEPKRKANIEAMNNLVDRYIKEHPGKKDEFEEYIRLHVFPCNCGEDGCEGWQFSSRFVASIMAASDEDVKERYDELFGKGAAEKDFEKHDMEAHRIALELKEEEG